MYAFYSPESTLSILQMSALMAAMIWLAGKTAERSRRHMRSLAVMAFVVANMCALVGSLWGDTIGKTIWGPDRVSELGYDAWKAANAEFMETAITLSPDVYSILWALVLAGMIFWAAHSNRRPLFNAAMTFAGIHAYTQLFESFGDQPLAYVIGGFAAIPLAWGIWRLNQRFGVQQPV